MTALLRRFSLRRRTMGFALALALTAAPAIAQEAFPTPSRITLELAPVGVRYTVHAADSILSSGTENGVSLESYNGDRATGVFLHGTHGGELESIGYGRDASDRRYMWLSVSRGDSIDYVAMLYDVDRDLLPDFLLFRAVDRGQSGEFLTEYRSPVARDVPFDITIQSACQPPRCDPASWTVHDRERVDVPAFWFEMWRPILSFAAMRGERWIGRPVASLPSAPRAPAPRGGSEP